MSAELIILVLALHVTAVLTVLRNPEMFAMALLRMSTCYRPAQNTEEQGDENEQLCSRAAVTEAQVQLYSESLLITEDGYVKILTSNDSSDGLHASTTDSQSQTVKDVAITVDAVTYSRATQVLYGEVQASFGSCSFTQQLSNYGRGASCYPDFHLND